MRSMRSFNSIKVRLRLYAAELRDRQAKFQFHKGTIKTMSTDQEQRVAKLFQFHKGTIKTLSEDERTIIAHVSIP